MPLVTDDLFSDGTWLRLGLDRAQLATTGLIGGALVGGWLDAATGGATFLAGALIGGAVGGLSGWLVKKPLSRVSIQGLKLGGRMLGIGPMRNPQFPWIALDRALLHQRAVSGRAHARRDDLALEGEGDRPGIVAGLPLSTRRVLESYFGKIKKARDPELREALTVEMARLVEELCG
jgi:hypothetical protein